MNHGDVHTKRDSMLFWRERDEALAVLTDAEPFLDELLDEAGAQTLRDLLAAVLKRG